MVILNYSFYNLSYHTENAFTYENKHCCFQCSFLENSLLNLQFEILFQLLQSQIKSKNLYQYLL